MGKALLQFFSQANLVASTSTLPRVTRQRRTAAQELFERVGFEFDLDADKFNFAAEVFVVPLPVLWLRGD
jgi:hypothetical protein